MKRIGRRQIPEGFADGLRGAPQKPFVDGVRSAQYADDFPYSVRMKILRPG
jgi:hypothetical protein